MSLGKRDIKWFSGMIDYSTDTLILAETVFEMHSIYDLTTRPLYGLLNVTLLTGACCALQSCFPSEQEDAPASTLGAKRRREHEVSKEGEEVRSISPSDGDEWPYHIDDTSLIDLFP